MSTTVEAHERIKDFDWEPTYTHRTARYPTKYKIPKKTKDPFRHIVRDYLTMEQEKDDRQYGGLEDALARSNVPAKADRGWMEAMKLALPIVSYAEVAAVKNTAVLAEAIDNAELRQGYLAQSMDEVRHVNQQIYLNRYFAKHAEDSEGFYQGLRVRGSNVFFLAARSLFETFSTGDPIECALSLQVIGETAYTNPLFVALTEVAAMNGDHASPSVFLSIQSDEARHMANGYSTLAAVLSEPDNLPLVQADLDKLFWKNHCFLDPLLAVVYDYFGRGNRRYSYKQKWDEWLADDWVGAYMGRLEPFGLKIPRWFPDAAERVQWLGHTAVMIAAAAWPFQFWRMRPLDDADFEWFEDNYPGWYSHYGQFWEAYRQLGDPSSGMIPFQLFPQRPPFCRTCHMPCAFPRPDISTVRVSSWGGKPIAFCSEACEVIFTAEPLRYADAAPTFDNLNHGVSLEEFIVKNGLLRADGKTLLAQPHLEDERMWTIDDIRRVDFTVLDPLQAPPASLANGTTKADV